MLKRRVAALNRCEESLYIVNISLANRASILHFVYVRVYLAGALRLYLLVISR